MLLPINLILTVAFCVTDGQFNQDLTQNRTTESSPLSNSSIQQQSKDDAEPQLQRSATIAPPVTRNKNSSDNEQNHDYFRIRPIPVRGESFHANTEHQFHSGQAFMNEKLNHSISSGSFRYDAVTPDKSEPRVATRRTELQHRAPRINEQRIKTQITVQNPRVYSKRIDQSRVPRRRSEGPPSLASEQKSREDMQEQEKSLSDVSKVNPFSQLDSQRFHLHSQNQQSLRQEEARYPRNRLITSHRTPVFDITRISTTNNSESQVRISKPHFINRDRYSPSAEPTDPIPSVIPVTKDGDEPRISKPLSFNLGTRRRIRYQRPIHNKATYNRTISQQGSPRSRPLIRYVRPKNSPNQQKETGIKETDPDILLNSKNESSLDSDLIPTPGSLQTTVSNNSSSIVPTTPPTPPASNQTLESTVGNITLSLQQARQLFARAQERYKAISGQNSSAGNITESTESAVDEPDGQYSSSYTKIRKSDGSITQLARLPPSTTTSATTILPPITGSLTSNNNESDPISRYLTTALFPTTTSQPPVDTTESITEKQNISITSPINATFSEISNENTSISLTPTLPPPVYKNSQFGLSQLGSLQNFTPFASGGSSQHQNFAGLLQQPVSPLTSGSNSQSLGLSNLFGLGNLPSLGSNLGSLSSFGLGQGFGSLTGEANRAEQPSSTGLNGGYLSLLSSLSGLGLGQLGGTSSTPELSLPSLNQGSSSSQSNNGLSFLSGLPSLSLSGLGNLGSLSSLGSIPSFGNLGGAPGTPGISGTGLRGLGLTNNGGVNGFGGGGAGGLHSFGLPGSTSSGFRGIGAGSSNLGSIFSKLAPTENLAPVLAQPAVSASKITQPIANVEDTLAAVNTPAALPSGDPKIAS